MFNLATDKDYISIEELMKKYNITMLCLLRKMIKQTNLLMTTKVEIKDNILTIGKTKIAINKLSLLDIKIHRHHNLGVYFFLEKSKILLSGTYFLTESANLVKKQEEYQEFKTDRMFLQCHGYWQDVKLMNNPHQIFVISKIDYFCCYINLILDTLLDDYHLYNIISNHGMPILHNSELHSEMLEHGLEIEIDFKQEYLNENIYIDFLKQCYFNKYMLEYENVIPPEMNIIQENNITASITNKLKGRAPHAFKQAATEIAQATYKKYNKNIQRQIMAQELAYYLNQQKYKKQIEQGKYKPISEETISRYLTNLKIGNRKGTARNLEFVDN